VLEEAGLVTRSRAANARPVRLAPAALATADQWIGDFRQFWEVSLARLEEAAKALQQKESQDD
jgi:hypothetical protein